MFYVKLSNAFFDLVLLCLRELILTWILYQLFSLDIFVNPNRWSGSLNWFSIGHVLFVLPQIILSFLNVWFRWFIVKSEFKRTNLLLVKLAVFWIQNNFLHHLHQFSIFELQSLKVLLNHCIFVSNFPLRKRSHRSSLSLYKLMYTIMIQLHQLLFFIFDH